MLSNRDPNGSGRSSRGSNGSGLNRITGKQLSSAHVPNSSSSLDPRVAGMLRTSTEMGGIDPSSFTGVPRAPQPRGASSRLSITSSMSNHSSLASRSKQYRRSGSMPPPLHMQHSRVAQYEPDVLSPTVNIGRGRASATSNGQDRTERRSRSMTNTPRAPNTLSSNRSFGSLYSEHAQQSRGTFYHPGVVRREYRPGTPGSSISSGTRMNRSDYGGTGQSTLSSYSHNQYSTTMLRPEATRAERSLFSTNQPITYASSVNSFDQQHGFRAPQQPSHRHQQSRAIPAPHINQLDKSSYRMPPCTNFVASPAFFATPGGGIPPVPPLPQQHIASRQHNTLHRSVKGSSSSTSTNIRTHTNTPSSENTTPPTPRIRPIRYKKYQTGYNRGHVEEHPDASEDLLSNEPLYYDGSEDFEDRSDATFVAPKPQNAGNSESAEGKALISTAGHDSEVTALFDGAEFPNVAELSASPVAQRLTRQIILEAIQPSSTTGDISTKDSDKSLATLDGFNHTPTSASIATTKDVASNQPSRISSSLTVPQGGYRLSSVVAGSNEKNSSDVEVAKDFHLPVAIHSGARERLASGKDGTSDFHITSQCLTDDRTSDLLTGYQRITSDASNRGAHEVYPPSERVENAQDQVKQRYHSVHTCSSARSLKSALRKSSELTSSTQSLKPTKRVSFEQDVLKPRNISSKTAPSSRNSSVRVCDDADEFPPDPRQGSDLIRRPDLPPYDNLRYLVFRDGRSRMLSRADDPRPNRSNESLQAAELRANNVDRAQDHSIALLHAVPDSAVIQDRTQKAPTIPTRESSSSQEAQRSRKVSLFLLRQLPSRIPFRQRRSKDKEALGKEYIVDLEAPQFYKDNSTDFDYSQPQQKVNADLSGSLNREDVVPDEQGVNFEPSEILNRFDGNNPEQSAIERQDRPDGVVKGAGESSAQSLPITADCPCDKPPAGVPQASRSSRYDSLTTTHLDWCNPTSYDTFPVSTSGPEMRSIRENTTTDLRLSGYRYGQVQCLPPLTEESQEDSSLNTSVDDLRILRSQRHSASCVTLPASFDQIVPILQYSSSLHQQSTNDNNMGHAGILPCIEFSHHNLLDKLREELGPGYSPLKERTAKLIIASGEKAVTSVSEPTLHHRDTSVNIVSDNGAYEDKSISVASSKTTALERLSSLPATVAEIEEIRLPSLGNLNQTLDDMLPWRSQAEDSQQERVDEQEQAIRETIQEIRQVGGPTQKRSSARLRALPGSSNLIVVDDIWWEHRDAKAAKSISCNHEGRGVRESSIGEGGSKAANKAISRTQITLHPAPFTQNTTLFQNSINISQEMTGNSEFPRPATPIPFHVGSFRPSHRPWVDHSPDISMPGPRTPDHYSSPGRSNLSEPVAEEPEEDSSGTGYTTTFNPMSSNGSYARRRNFGESGRNETGAHAAGERYPTSGLSSPQGAITVSNVPENNSIDTAGEDLTLERGSGFKKRFSTAIRQATRVLRGESSEVNEPTMPELEKQVARSEVPPTHRHTYRDAQGMRMVDYHRHKLTNRFKHWWRKCNGLFSNKIVGERPSRSGHKRLD